MGVGWGGGGGEEGGGVVQPHTKGLSLQCWPDVQMIWFGGAFKGGNGTQTGNVNCELLCSTKLRIFVRFVVHVQSFSEVFAALTDV